MRQAVLPISILVAVAGCVDSVGSAESALGIEHDCTVDGFGSLAAGDTFSGTASSILGVDAADWIHDSTGLHLESDGAPAETTCRLNGGTVADFFGAATLNGSSGYTYAVHLVDNSDPPQASDIIILEASRPGHGRPIDGTASFADPTTVTVPAQIDVIDGEASPGQVLLELDDSMCFYRRNASGDAYVLRHCEDGLAAGDTVDVTSLRLHVAGCGHGVLTVSADLSGPAPAPGPADTYSILIGDSSGTVLHAFAGDLATGDIDIVLDP